MKRAHQSYSVNRLWLMPVLTIAIFSLLLLLTVILSLSKPSSTTGFSFNRPKIADSYQSLAEPSELPRLPKFAYLISGTRGEGTRVKRLLQAVYHPRNYYVLHLDLEAPDAERLELAKYAKLENAIGGFGNVMVIGKADLITYKGPTTVASTLHAIAILLKQAEDWDWFINLSASDYPLMSQDDILNIFSYLPKDLNFLEHTSSIGWKENERARPIIIDPGLYHPKKSGVFWAKEKRSLPAAFKLFI
ncbi:beta-glucuronosyltransferase GlcAT14C-like, partial [Carica papaya]|uniref:beta-glucuronosyltransferase GlcAT14C-like n=1 Tax=Carica papaya TaxID=3649 RepID=UPI000B8C8FC7